MIEGQKGRSVGLRCVLGVCVLAFLILNCRGESLGAGWGASHPAETDPTPVTKKAKSKVKFSSAYTKLDAKTCRPIKKALNDEEVPDICRGYKDYKIFVSHHGTATRIYIGREISPDVDSWDASTLPNFIANLAGAGQVIEWRLADGVPFACIVRARYDRRIINPDEKGEINELVVQNLKGFAPVNIVIDARKTPRANKVARQRADAAYGRL